MKKFVILTMLAAAVAALCFTGCTKTSEGESVYEITLSMEGENSNMFSLKDTDAKNAFDQINAKLSDFTKEVKSQWVEKGNADKDAKKKFTEAKDKLVEVEKECETIVKAIPSGSTGIFVISRALLLRKVSSDSGDETLEKYSISFRYPAE